MNNKRGSAIILLSGGLDSYISLLVATKGMDVKLALTFDYGQVAFEEEVEAAAKMVKAEGFEIPHKVIKLPFLRELTDVAEIWVPNRNGLFLNIAASFADKIGFDYIVFGANKEESAEFKDNSIEFLNLTDELFTLSTQKKPRIFAPLKDLNKTEIVNLGLSLGADFKLLKSCYNSEAQTGKKHCGACKSCLFLKNALKNSNHSDLIKHIF